MQAVWGLDSGKVGLVFIAAVVPTLFCTFFLRLNVLLPASPGEPASPATGYLADKYGAEWVAALTMFLSLPWWVTLIIEKQLVLFIVVFAIECECSRSREIGMLTLYYSHVYNRRHFARNSRISCCGSRY